MFRSCRRRASALAVFALFCPFPPALFAQVSGGAAGQLQGIVSDSSGAVVPGASLVLRDTGTGIEKNITTSEDGHYTFLALQAGAYDLTVSKPGFQKSLLSNIVVATSRITDQAVTLSVGNVVDTVEVQGESPVLETSSSQLSLTVQNKELQTLPLSGRDTLPFATLMPGNQNVGVGTQSGRTGTFNGLPNAAMNISMDGMNNNSQRFKSGGTSFFAFATARLDAIQEITVTTAGTGADASGDGAMQIQFVTKRGTDDYHFKVFEQFQNDALNANGFFNNSQGLAKTKLRQNDVGGNFGGPLVPFVPYLKHRLFFFANFEATPIPGARVSTATVLTPQAQSGTFSYIGTDRVRRDINVLALAARNNQSGTVDPTVANLLNTANGTLSKGVLTSSTTDLLRQTLTWNQPTTNNTYYPTTRVDYQIAPRLAWHGTWNLRYNNTSAYPQYPDLPVQGNAYKITTYVASNTLDWTIKSNMINSATFGVQSNGEYFYQGTDVSQWGPFGNRYVNLGLSVTPTIPTQTPFIRNNPVYQFKDTFTWLKGKHSISIGASWLHSSFYETSWNAPGGGGVSTYTLGVDASDPINSSVFTNANFPAIASTDLANAAQLYATLTGRLSGISGGLNVDENSHQYTPFAPITQRFAYTTSGLFAQDSFHVTPHLTLNYGFRWQFTTPVTNTNNIDLVPTIANFYGPSVANFQPGNLSGIQNPVLTQQSAAYAADYKQPAPNFGFAWNPGYQDGWMGKILGPETVIRGSYGINFYDEGMNAISNVMSSNYGSTQSLSLTPGQAGFTPGALSLSSSIPALNGVPGAFSSTLPQSGFALANKSIYAVDPNLRVPYVQNWTFGIQRKISDSMVFEARYVGNKSTHMWHYYNTQETNIFENGFLSEFSNAQKNLSINQANGRTGFANNSLPGQVALPIMQAAFGARGSQAAMPAAFTNGTFLTQLQQGQAGAFAQSLATTIAYYCRLVGNSFGPCASNGYNAPGAYPINFFQANPYAAGRFLQTYDGNSNYNGLQLEFRKAVSHGLSFNANYTWSHTMSNIFNSSDQTATSQVRTLRNSRLDYGPTPFDIRHVFQGYWTYALPIGKGRALGVSNPILNAVVGGWNVSGIHRWTSGHPFKLVTGTGTTVYNSFNNLADAGIALNGITVNQLQSMFNSVSASPNKTTVNFINPSLIGSDGRANTQYLSPNQVAGTLGANVFLYGPGIVTTDAAISKEIVVKERLRFGIQAEALNVFNHPVFSATPSASSTVGTATTVNITSTSFGQTTQIQVPSRNIQLRAYIQF